MHAMLNVLLGGVGAIVFWFVTEFVGRPFRQFFDLRREVARRMIQFDNVGARSKMEGDRRIPIDISADEAVRLKEAETTLRDLASQVRAFATAESFAARVVKWFGFDAWEISRALIGYSNEIGTFGQARALFADRIMRLLHIQVE